MDKKTYLPILFTSFNSQHSLETIAFEHSPKRNIVGKYRQINKNKSSSLQHINSHNQKSSLILPLFNHINTIKEYFTIEDPKPQPDQQEKNICIGRYVNTKEMLSHLVYGKKTTKDNRIVFENKKEKDKSYFSDSYSNTFQYVLGDHSDMTLLFESSFECGNLLAAFKLDTITYQLLLQSDTNTTGYNKWFFFMVNNMRKGYRYTFTFINSLKQNKNYSKGIKIFTYSNQKNANEKIGWHHLGDDINYYPNNLYQFNNNKKQRLYTLSFSYECKYDNDVIYFANCIPYSYSKIMSELNQYKSNKQYQCYYTQSTLCQSLGGYYLDYFIINNKSKAQIEKEGIVFFARQHPSETVGSWVIQGAIDFLLSQSEEALYLREHFEILVIPMVNIDGVIGGNTRTSFAGCDLNRKWRRPKKNKHPEIFYIKELIRQFSIKRKIMCLVDFHGHHSAFNSFFYCNYNEQDINQARAFPYACAKNSNCINFDQCSFSMMKYKNGAGRINLYKEFGIENACTLETSCFGLDKGKYASQYINENILQEIGRDVCMGVITYHYYKHSWLHIPIEISQVIKQKIEPVFMELIEGKMNIKEEDFTDTNGDNSDDEDNNDNDIYVIEDDEDEKMDEERNKDKIVNRDNDKANINTKTEFGSLKYITGTLPIIKKNKLKVASNNMIESANLFHMKTEKMGENETDGNYSRNTNRTKIDNNNKNVLNLFQNSTLLYHHKPLDNSDSKLNLPLREIIKIKSSISIYSTRFKNFQSIQKERLIGAKKTGINLLMISPKKFYSTRDAMTQTEDIYFDIKLIYYSGLHKIMEFDAERERQMNKRKINYLNTFGNINDKKGIDNNNKESISTQTESKA